MLDPADHPINLSLCLAPKVCRHCYNSAFSKHETMPSCLRPDTVMIPVKFLVVYNLERGFYFELRLVGEAREESFKFLKNSKTERFRFKNHNRI